jgi:adenylylsulfate kinase-like enzyme
LNLGDRNTKYFHACASQRQRRNQISHIVAMDGSLCSGKDTIDQAFIEYYQNLFISCTGLDIEACTRVLTPRVSPDMNDKLVAEFSVEEISDAMNQMPPMKAPGHD